MNAYIIVEGDKTETKVYPAWLEILAPDLKRVDRKDDIEENNYYLFSGHGIPSIYDHIVASIEDINSINAGGKAQIDYLIICIDTEEETREDIEREIAAVLEENKLSLNPPCRMVIFEHRVSMESWFLGNAKLLSATNTQSELLRSYRALHDVREKDPELMGNLDTERFETTAQFHHSYLKEVFKENKIKYKKSNPTEVCKKHYLDRLIERFKKTGHISSFGRWYEFIISNFQKRK